MTVELDIVIVGGGFGGIYTLYKLRNLGFKVHLIEAAHTLGKFNFKMTSGFATGANISF